MSETTETTTKTWGDVKTNLAEQYHEESSRERPQVPIGCYLIQAPDTLTATIGNFGDIEVSMKGAKVVSDDPAINGRFVSGAGFGGTVTSQTYTKDGHSSPLLDMLVAFGAVEKGGRMPSTEDEMKAALELIQGTISPVKIKVEPQGGYNDPDATEAPMKGMSKPRGAKKRITVFGSHFAGPDAEDGTPTALNEITVTLTNGTTTAVKGWPTLDFRSTRRV
jgi:hypothetical protein